MRYQWKDNIHIFHLVLNFVKPLHLCSYNELLKSGLNLSIFKILISVLGSNKAVLDLSHRQLWALGHSISLFLLLYAASVIYVVRTHYRFHGSVCKETQNEAWKNLLQFCCFYSWLNRAAITSYDQLLLVLIREQTLVANFCETKSIKHPSEDPSFAITQTGVSRSYFQPSMFFK